MVGSATGALGARRQRLRDTARDQARGLPRMAQVQGGALERGLRLQLARTTARRDQAAASVLRKPDGALGTFKLAGVGRRHVGQSDGSSKRTRIGDLGTELVTRLRQHLGERVGADLMAPDVVEPTDHRVDGQPETDVELGDGTLEPLVLPCASHEL